jgi:hypothetical protein
MEYSSLFLTRIAAASARLFKTKPFGRRLSRRSMNAQPMPGRQLNPGPCRSQLDMAAFVRDVVSQESSVPFSKEAIAKLSLFTEDFITHLVHSSTNLASPRELVSEVDVNQAKVSAYPQFRQRAQLLVLLSGIMAGAALSVFAQACFSGDLTLLPTAGSFCCALAGIVGVAIGWRRSGGH